LDWGARGVPNKGLILSMTNQTSCTGVNRGGQWVEKGLICADLGCGGGRRSAAAKKEFTLRNQALDAACGGVRMRLEWGSWSEWHRSNFLIFIFDFQYVDDLAPRAQGAIFGGTPGASARLTRISKRHRTSSLPRPISSARAATRAAKGI
jgi:hypothetical protein